MKEVRTNKLTAWYSLCYVIIYLIIERWLTRGYYYSLCTHPYTGAVRKQISRLIRWDFFACE